MRKDLDEMYRLGLYGNGIERIKLKKAVQIIQKASASQVKIVDIGHDNFDSACEALELGSVDMAVVDMAQLIRMEKNDENLPYGYFGCFKTRRFKICNDKKETCKRHY